MVRRVLVQATLLLFIASPLCQETPGGGEPAAPSVDQIVSRMEQHEAAQAEELKHYEAVRHYQVQYRGFGATLSAKMDVRIDYNAGSGKSFRILSQSGSKLLCDKVLKRAVESEAEASHEEASTALTPANYRFELTGSDTSGGRPAWVLHVDPLRPGKFLYRGSVWVDAADGAVQKIEVEPAKNPSFWITSTKIDSLNADDQGIWLPRTNRSESKIRIGGTAVLSIDYGEYQIVESRPEAAGAGR